MDRSYANRRSPREVTYASSKGSHSPRQASGGVNLDFGKYLIGGKKQPDKMESDQTTESETSDWEPQMTRYTGTNITLPPHLYSTDTSGESEGLSDYETRQKFPQMYDTAIDSPVHQTEQGQNEGGNKDHYGYNGNDPNRGEGQGHFNTSSRSIDSALGNSLYTVHETPGSQTDTSGNNSDITGSNSGSPVHNPVYGRYQKTVPALNLQKQNFTENGELLESLMLHRLPGENLGMILGIEGGKDGIGTVLAVTVKSVTLGGAAHRATGSCKGICVGDEILDINGTNLRTLSHDECITVFKEMPLRVVMTVKRGQKDLPALEISPVQVDQTIEHDEEYDNPSNHGNNGNLDTSESEDEGLGGFGLYDVVIPKDRDENLGLSIVPSYGSTKEFYQIKRILPSGAAARSGQLKVGDRLISCNGQNLQNLTQNHCLNILKSASGQGDVDLEILRSIDDGAPMEISVTVNNNSSVPGYDSSQYSLKSLSYDRDVDVVVTSESEDYLTVSEDELSHPDQLPDFLEEDTGKVFAETSSRLNFKKSFTPIEEVDTTEAESDTETESTPDENSGSKDGYLVPGVDIVDLNRINTSPYHIPSKTGSQTQSAPKPFIQARARTGPLPRQRTPVPSEFISYPDVEDSSKEDSETSSDEGELNNLDVALPPPLEFSDNPEGSAVIPSLETESQDYSEACYSIPYTNIDDILPSSDSDKTPTHQIQVVEVQVPNYQGNSSPRQKMEIETSQEVKGLGKKSDTQSSPRGQNGFADDANLAFNAEVTVSNDLIEEDQTPPAGNNGWAQGSPYVVPEEYTGSTDDEVLEVVQNTDSGKITVTVGSKTEKSGFVQPDTMPTRVTMDTDSEAMLKNALDMEYDKLGDENQLQHRLALGSELQEVEPDFSQKPVALLLAKEMADQEQAPTGSYTESDEEPDTIPDADQPEDLPDELPVEADISAQPKVSLISVGSSKVDVDTDWQPSVVVSVNNVSLNKEDKIIDSDVIIPQKLERKTVIPVHMAQKYKDDNDDDGVIVPVKVERKVDISSKNIDLKTSPRQVSPPSPEIIIEIKPRITVTSGKPKPAVPPKPTPRKTTPAKTTTVPDEDEDAVEEPEIVAEVLKRDQTKSVINVVRAVSAMKGETSKADKEGLRKVISSVITVGPSDTAKEEDKADIKDSEPSKKERETSKADNEGLRKVISSVITVGPSDTAKEEDKADIKDSEPSKKERETSKADNEGLRKVISSVIAVGPSDTVKEEDKADIKDSEPSKKERETSKADNEGLRKVISSVITVGPSDTVKEEDKADIKDSEPSKKDIAKPETANLNDEQVKVPVSEISHTTSIDIKKPAEAVASENPLVSSQNVMTPSVTNVTVSKPQPQSKHSSSILNVNGEKTTETKSQPQKQETVIKVTKSPTAGTTSIPLLAHPHIKPITNIRPLSFNPKTLSKPTQLKTTISTVGLKPAGTSLFSRSSVFHTPKVEHPIKRMETMPFGVSILKGILGIGIKTSMSPDGYVLVMEILPSGPVGREGNIKVGDYLLSINNTELTGLPDSKVQQILRLLPRGLSKLVASAVPPSQSADVNKNTLEEKPVSLKEPSPVSSPRQLTITTETKPTVITSPRQLTTTTETNPTVITSPRQLTITTETKPTSPRQPLSSLTRPIPSPREKSPTSPRQPVQSPISPRQPVQSPISPRKEEVKPTPSPRAKSPSFFPKQAEQPTTSPRQLLQSPTSPKQPPPVAPKPRKSLEEGKTVVTVQQTNSTGPIDTEVFVSINDSSSKPVERKTSSNVLPGSVSYDTVEPTSPNSNGWTAGVVSSSSPGRQITTTDIAGSVGAQVTGKVDVVFTDLPNVDTQEAEKSGVDISQESDQTKETVTEDKEDNKFVFRASSITSEDEDEEERKPGSARERTLSGSSNTSYTEFKECSVEEECIPEVDESSVLQADSPTSGEVLDEDENSEHQEQEQSDSSELSQGDIEVEEEQVVGASSNPNYSVPRLDLEGITGAESDDHEEENRDEESPISSSALSTETESTPLESPAQDHNIGQLQNLAETIVSQVMESVREMDIDFDNYEYDFEKDETDNAMESVINVDEVDARNTSNNVEDISQFESEQSNTLQSSQNTEAPPIPAEAPPPIPTEAPPPLPESPPPIPLSPPPDAVFTSDNKFEESAPKSQSPRDIVHEEIVERSQSAPVHAESPIVSLSQTHDRALELKNDPSSCHENQSSTNDSLLPQVTGDSGESDVTDVKVNSQDLEDDEVKSESVGDQNKYEVISMYSDINKSNTSINDSNDSTPAQTTTSDHSETSLSAPESNNNETSPVESSTAQQDVEPKQTDDQSNNDNGLPPISPRSDSSSDVSSPLQRSGGMSYSADVERMIRVMSVSDEPQEGKGEIIQLTLSKGVTGLGFVIQGGKGSPKGDLPITIRRIFKGGPVDNGQLQPKDELLEVNGEDLTNMKHSDAWNYLKFLPSGDIALTIRRYSAPEVEEEQ